MFTIEVKVTGLKEVRRKMERLGSSIYDFKEEFDSIGRDVVAYYKGPGFASQGGVFGNKWQRLSVPYMLLALVLVLPLCDIQAALRLSRLVLCSRDSSILPQSRAQLSRIVTKSLSFISQLGRARLFLVVK